MRLLDIEKADITVISNVLNVIDSIQEIRNILKQACLMSKGNIYITVYEGNKTGIGIYTSKDSYQRNMKTKEYLKIIQSFGYNCSYRNGMIIIKPDNRAEVDYIH